MYRSLSFSLFLLDVFFFAIIPLICCAPMRLINRVCLCVVFSACVQHDNVGCFSLFPPLPWNVRLKNLSSILLLLLLLFDIHLLIVHWVNLAFQAARVARFAVRL